MTDVTDEQRGELGRSLRRLRLARGFSQSQLSRATDGLVSGSLIALVEKGERGIGLERAEALSQVLELETDEHDELMRAAGHRPAEGHVSLADRLATVEAAVEEMRATLQETQGLLQQLVDEVGRSGIAKRGARSGRGR